MYFVGISIILQIMKFDSNYLAVA